MGEKVCHQVVIAVRGSGVRSLEELFGDFYRDVLKLSSF